MVLPVGDRNPTRRRPYVTVTLIAANVAVFMAYNLQLPEPQLTCFIYRWAAVPAELFDLHPISPTQAPVQPACLPAALAAKSVLLSTVTSMFLHGSLGHLLFNMLFLWIFGNNVEDDLGHGTYLLYYLVGGLVAVYAFALINTDTTVPLLGASGAIAAVLGGYLVLHPRARIHTYVPFPLYLLVGLLPRARISGWFLIFAIVDLPAWLVLSFWFVTQLTALAEATAGGEGVAYEAHIAGFVAGVVATLLLRATGSTAPPRRGQPVHW
ncbi:MAG TPA: rhomboid family intramembrane serine protease [Nitriliruptorales bacterium]|nr:rhomboid family intramembrane serine protease [Nitriliruptorales bacterium]